jgi:hypothetical protein
MGHFLSTIFDAEEVYNSVGKKISISAEKFFIVGDIRIAIMEGEPLSKRSYNHRYTFMTTIIISLSCTTAHFKIGYEVFQNIKHKRKNLK